MAPLNIEETCVNLNRGKKRKLKFDMSELCQLVIAR